MIKTIAELRKAHKGYWFKNTKPPYHRIVGGLRKGRFIITQDTERDLDKITVDYRIWGIYEHGDNFDFRLLTRFSNRNTAISEIGSDSLNALYYLNMPKRGE